MSAPQLLNPSLEPQSEWRGMETVGGSCATYAFEGVLTHDPPLVVLCRSICPVAHHSETSIPGLSMRTSRPQMIQVTRDRNNKVLGLERLLTCVLGSGTITSCIQPDSSARPPSKSISRPKISQCLRNVLIWANDLLHFIDSSSLYSLGLNDTYIPTHTHPVQA